MRDLGRTCRTASRLLTLAVFALSAPALLARAALAQPHESSGRKSAFEIAAEGQLGYFRMAATDTATATFGSPNALTFGGGLRATVWRGAFVSVGVRTFSKTGERVFLSSPDSPVQKLGHPLDMRTTTGQLALGYRFWNGKLIVPYLSAGVALASYKERSEVAGEPFDVDKTKVGFTGAAGVEVGKWFVRFGAEVGYTTIPNTIGSSGVSKVYGETNVGGLHATGKLVIAFGL